MGGMRRVVQNEIDEVLSAEPEQRARQLAELRAAFIPWLATINPDNDQPMRRVARWTDLPAASRPLIDAFVDKRLLVKDQRDGEVVVEVALESLLRQWDDLAGWLRDERHNLKAADDVERNAAAWEAATADPAWLLTGTRLADAEESDRHSRDTASGWNRPAITWPPPGRPKIKSWPPKRSAAKPNSATPKNDGKPPKNNNVPPKRSPPPKPARANKPKSRPRSSPSARAFLPSSP